MRDDIRRLLMEIELEEADAAVVDDPEAAPPDAERRDAEAEDAPPRLDHLPPWRVLLHNDQVNDMRHVVDSILELTTLTKITAIERMLEAHTRGLALLLTTHREHAELLQEQFQTKRLKVSIEPA